MGNPAKSLKWIRMPGSKARHVEIINDAIDALLPEDRSHITYVEPFCGSGAVFFNVRREFGRYVMNDKRRDFVQIYDTTPTTKQILERVAWEKQKHGIEGSKEAYLWFRDNIYNRDREWDASKVIDFFMMGNMSVSQQKRWGPKGFNISWGGGHAKVQYSHLIDSFVECCSIIRSRKKRDGLVCFNTDWERIMSNDRPGILWIVDPPYWSKIHKDNADFMNLPTGWWRPDVDSKRLCEMLAASSNPFIYFDFVDNPFIEQILLKRDGTSAIKIAEIHKLSRHKREEQQSRTEVMVVGQGL